jgi:hypothetical protein
LISTQKAGASYRNEYGVVYQPLRITAIANGVTNSIERLQTAASNTTLNIRMTMPAD